MATWERVGLRLLLAGAMVFAMLSYGGLLIFVFLPLAVGCWWMVRHSGPVERWAWIVLAALAAAEWSWEITYPVTEGETPASWVNAIVAAMVMGILLTIGQRYAISRQPKQA